MKKQYQGLGIQIYLFEPQDIVTFSGLLGAGVEDSTTHKDVYENSNRWW